MKFSLAIKSGVHAILKRVFLYSAVSTVLLVISITGHVSAQGNAGPFNRIDLVTNIFGRTEFSDSRLSSPWGIVDSPDGGPWWVTDEGKGLATVYSGEGTPLPGLSPLAITIPVIPGGITDDSTPTDVVMNSGGGFELAPGVPARLIFVTRDGSIAGWNSEIGNTEAVTVVDNSPDAAYTGAAVAGLEGERALYAANFRQGRIDVYGADFNPLLRGEYAFFDPFIPEGFSPYNVRNLGGELYVTFAWTRSDGRYASYGEGAGYVDIFDAGGNLVLRLEHGPWMNAPWAVALAPEGFGKLGGHVLVGNGGSGRICVFDPQTGSFEGYLTGASGSALTIPGLRGINFGNGGLAGPETSLYFTAAEEKKGRSVFGTIVPSPSLSPSQPARPAGVVMLP